jgi:4-hydroxybenzoyl-CoA reductase subunit beta
MMRCSPFSYRAPASVEEVAQILATEGPKAMVLGGGTDLVPNMKRRQQTPALLVSLRRVPTLRRLQDDGPGVRIGAGMTLAEIAAHPRLRAFGALGRAAAQVATTHIRNVGTLGGNLCLDTRCNYYNQNYEWRTAIDFCMKRGSEGGGWPEKNEAQVCWVAPGSPRCWAVSSTDCAPALIALGAKVTLVSARETREIDLAALYRDDGIQYLDKRPDEILTEVRLGDPAGWRSTYWKLRRRESFDFPVLSLGAAVRFEGDGTVREARLVFGAVASHPVVAEAAAGLVGHRLDDAAIERCADAAVRLAKPLDNTDFALGWRKRVARSFVIGALRELRGDDPAQLGLIARRQMALRVLGA